MTQFLFGRLHDMLAGCCATVVTLIVLHHLTVTPGKPSEVTHGEQIHTDASKAHSAPSELTTLIPLPPDLGLPGDDDPEPDPWQPAGTESRPASAAAPPARDVDRPPSAAAAPGDDVSDNKAPQATAVNAARDVAKKLPPQTPDEWPTPETTFPWDVSPPSEVSPLPAREMSAEQLRSTVEEYERWVHRGQITLRVDCSLLDDDHLDSICALYVLCSKRSFVAVQPGGGPRQLERQDIPPDKLIGDLPRDRSRWPKVVAEAAYRSFGPGHSAHVVMLISDATALEIYRALAQHVGASGPQASELVYMRLRPATGHVRCEVVSR